MLSSTTLKSSVGKKAIMAITGLLLLGFVVGHLLGNLLIFLGPDALNAYAKKLLDLGPGLWVARLSLLAFLVAHILTAVKLTNENRAARTQPYLVKKNIETTYAARTMMVSGILIFVFIIYHLLHFTFKVTNPDISHATDALGRHDVYSMVVLSFQQLPIACVYVVAMFLLCNHLKHGITSLFQSLGLHKEECIPITQKVGLMVALLIFVGYISIPISVQLGIIEAAGGHP